MLTHPLFLIGLLAVGIPIAVHLLQLRRYKQVYFSNVDMLESLQNVSRKQQNLRRRLILAARILAIVSLVLAFCQPVIRRDSALRAGDTVVSVYVDNSYSMECGGMDGSLLESARAKAREIAEAYKPGTLFQLLTNEASGSQFRWLGREEFLAAVDELRTGAVTVPLSAMARRQQEFLHTASAANRHAYVVSDFQRSTADVADYPSDSTVRTTFIPLEGSRVANVFIDSMVFSSPAYFPGAAVEVEVFVRNMGDKPVEQLPLRLFVGHKQRALTSVSLAAQGGATAKMVFTIESGTPLQGFVETTDYPVTFDDRMFFSLPVLTRVPVLAVNGVADNPYLLRLFQGDSLVDYRSVSAGQVDFSRLAQNGLVILNELHSITSGLAQALQDYVRQGGALLVVPPESVETASYNQFLASMRAPELGPWTADKCRVSEVQDGADLYQGVFQGRDADMEMPLLQGRYRLATTATTVSQSLIRLSDGTDYLACTPCGEGRLYLFSAPLQAAVTDFVHQALFVPTVYNMALYSHPLPSPYNLLSAPAPIPLAPLADDPRPPHLVSADGAVDLIPDIRRMGTRPCLVPHGELSLAGNYQLRAADSADAGQPLSFNYSRQESVLDFYSRGELRRLIKEADLDHCGLAPAARKSMTDYIRQQDAGTPLWRLFLILALLALLAETILIRRCSDVKMFRRSESENLRV